MAWPVLGRIVIPPGEPCQQELYAKAAEATAFVQQKAEPEIFDKAYTGMGGESGGVVGMLEVTIKAFPVPILLAV